MLCNIPYIIGKGLISTFQYKVNYVNPFSCSWDISQQNFYTYNALVGFNTVICKSTHLEITSLQNNHTSPPFSQHVLWQCYTHLGIQSSTVEILLFNSVFHDGVTPISVSILKPPLGVIGFYHWNPEYLLYYQFVYKTSSYTVIC